MSRRPAPRTTPPPPRARRLFLLIPLAALALLALGVLVTFVLSGDRNDGSLSKALDRQIGVLQASSARAATEVDAGRPLEASMLQEFSVLAETVSGEVDSAPDWVSGDSVYAYAQVIAGWQELLVRGDVRPGVEDALARARTQAETALLVVARYFNARPDQVPAEASGSSPSR